MKDFPVDIWSVKEYGIEAWRKEFFWPVTNQELQTLFGTIEDLYLGIASESPPDVRDALWVLYSCVISVTTLFHAHMVTQRLQQEGFMVRYHSSSWYYKTLIEGKAIQSIMVKPLPKVLSSTERIRGQLRSWRDSVKYHGFDVGYYFDRSRRPPFLAVEWRGQREDFAAFAASQGKHLAIVHWSQLMPTGLRRTDDLPGASQAVNRFVSGLQTIAHEHDIQVERKHLESLNDLLLNSLQYIADYIHAVSQALYTREPTSVLLQGLGNLALRSLCVAGRKAGHHIVGFPHGNDVGIYKHGYRSWILRGMVDTFVVPTQGAVELFSLSLKKFLRPYGKSVDLVVVKSNEYEKIRTSTRAKMLPSSVKKVMVVEYPMHQFCREGSDAAFWSYQLDLTLRIADLIRRPGIKTIVKRHPDRLQESEGVYDGYFEELLTPSFEEVYDVADAYVFTTLRSTTFGFALLTNKPVIIFEHTLEDVWEPAREPLRKRCRVVPSWIAEDGRIMFDEDKLVDALLEPPEEPNDEFIERYML